MKRFAIIAAVALLYVSNLCFAGELTKIPYDPNTDLSKISADLHVSTQDVLLHTRCAYVQLDAWAPNVPLKSFNTCVLLITKDHVVLSTWNEANGNYSALIDLRYQDISNASLSIEGAKYQLQLTYKLGMIVITTSRYKVPPPGDTSESSIAFELLKSNEVPTSESPGRVEPKMPQFLVVPRFK